MILFFELTIVAKTNETVLQFPSPFIQCWSTNNCERQAELSAILQHLIGCKEDYKNIKENFLLLH